MARRNSTISIIDKYIGKKVYELRLALGLSRQELGRKIDVTHQQLEKYEKGKNRISAGRLLLLARVFGKPIEYFYSDIDEHKAVEVKTKHQRMCIEVSRSFMRIENPVYQDAVNTLVKSLAK